MNTKVGDQQRKRKARTARNKAILEAIKLERGCIDCGYNEHAVALDFDHRDPSMKRMNVSRFTRSGTITQLLAEIAKCDVRCANCHRWKEHGP